MGLATWPLRCPAALLHLLLLLTQVHELDADGPAAAGSLQGASDWASERELLARLREASYPGGNELVMLRLCISRSWWDAARELVSQVHARSASGAELASIKDDVTSLLDGVKRRADDFAVFANQVYRTQTQGLNEVQCALQWAQNSTAVFLGVKYAARWSAPGAIEIADLSVKMNSCCFELEGYGHHSSVRKRYIVNLTLFGDIDAAKSSWSASSVGRMTATLQKAVAGRWSRLAKTKEKAKLPAITTWLDMEEKWAHELKATSGDNKAKVAKPSPRPAPRTNKEGSSTQKAKRVRTPWRKLLLRQWRRLVPAPLRRVLTNPFYLFAIGSLIIGFGVSWTTNSYRSGNAKNASPVTSSREMGKSGTAEGA